VSSVCPLIDNFTRKYYAAQPNSSTSLSSTSSSVFHDKILVTARTKLDADQKWLIEYLTVVGLKELDAG